MKYIKISRNLGGVYRVNNAESTITFNKHYKCVLILCNLYLLYNNVGHSRN